VVIASHILYIEEFINCNSRHWTIIEIVFFIIKPLFHSLEGTVWCHFPIVKLNPKMLYPCQVLKLVNVYVYQCEIHIVPV
jgi:hypothetical protein